MNLERVRAWWLVLVVAGASALGGCAPKQLMQERDALWAQNQELQSELNHTRSELNAAVSERSHLSGELNRLRMELENQARPIAAPAVPTSGFSQIEGVETTMSAGQITVRVPGDVLFAAGKVTLKSTSMKTLDKIAGVISREYPGHTIRIKGFTDTDPIRKSKWTDNLELSLERAAAVHRYLAKQGVSPELMEAVGLGQWHPAGSKAKSRRVEIVVVMR